LYLTPEAISQWIDFQRQCLRLSEELQKNEPSQAQTWAETAASIVRDMYRLNDVLRMHGNSGLPIQLENNFTPERAIVELNRMMVVLEKQKIANLSEAVGKDKDNNKWPEVDVTHNYVRFRGVRYDVTDDQAVGLKALVDARGDWVSWSGRKITKPSRVRKNLPDVLQKHITSAPGKGYRFVP